MIKQGNSRKGADPAVLLQAAVAAHQRGALDVAARGYESVLAVSPQHPETLYLSGALMVQQGQHARALERLKRCVVLQPDHLFAAEALGAAALGAGDAALAVTWLEKAVAGRPDAVTARANLARAYAALARTHSQQGRWGEAERLCRRAHDLDPRNADALYVLANASRLQGHAEAAAEAYEALIALQPTQAASFDAYGGVLFTLGRLSEAERAIRTAIELAPDNANAYTNLGRLYFPNPEKAAWALELHDRAIALQPDHAEAHSNRGTALYLLGRFDEAATSHRRAIALKPGMAEAHNNLGNDLIKLGDVDGALACYRAAIAHAPDYADAHLNAALALLSSGRLAEGWRAYERRWDATVFKGCARPFTQSRWDGHPTDGTLLIWGEQGVGDEILYASMVPDLIEAGQAVVWEMDSRLVPLIRRSFPKVKATGRATPPDPATAAASAQIATASLGQFLRPDANAFAKQRPFLQADSARSARYRRNLLGDDRARLIGLSWISKNPDLGVHKTLPLATMAPILKIPGTRCVDLQYGDTSAERAEAEQASGIRLHHVPDLDLFNDLDGLAALIAACNLVITVSNTTAHLAGALGVPTWVLVSPGVGKLWYWGQSGARTPWYPSVRLFRQPSAGSWDETIAAVVRELAGS